MNKRIVDFIAALIGLLLLAPRFAAAAVWIKIDSRRPRFRRQQRVGKDGIAFNITTLALLVP